MALDRRSLKVAAIGFILVAPLTGIAVWQAGAWVGSSDHPGTASGQQAARSDLTPNVDGERQPRETVSPAPVRPRPTDSATTAEAPSPSAPTVTQHGVLRLPTLDVAAPVQLLPVRNDGTLDPPSDYTTVGLWPLGSQPGDERGTAIIAGHTVHTGGGALDNLENMVPGEEVILERPGPDLTYRVTSVTTYRKATLAQDAAEIFSQTVPGRLAVVTCEDWDGSVYLSNVVVIATPA